MTHSFDLTDGVRTTRSGFVLIPVLLSLVASPGCVTRQAYNELDTDHARLQTERDALQTRVEHLTIERDSLEEQFIEAQESYEDERVVRSTLASNLSQLQQKADTLDADLDSERSAHIQAATALAAREAEIAAMQSTYDSLVSDLESEVSSGQIEIERLREGLRLNVSDDVLFASGSAQLDRIGREVLVKVAGQLTSLGDFIEVRGHTDNRAIRGSLAKRYPTNWELAAARAARVVRLLEEHGVPGDRLAAVSLGPNDPVAPNDTAANRAINRRIEIRLEPRGGAAPIPAKKPAQKRAPKAAVKPAPAPPAAAAPQQSQVPSATASPAAQAPTEAEVPAPIASADRNETQGSAATARAAAEADSPPVADDVATVSDEEPMAPLESVSES